MPFNPSNTQLQTEIDAAEKRLGLHTHRIKSIVTKYVGSFYRSADIEAGSEYDPENHTYAFVSYMLPSLVFDNPGANVTARQVVGHKRLIAAMQAGLNSWILDIGLKAELERVVTDFLFFQGVAMIRLEEDYRWANGSVRPVVYRIPYKDFLYDAVCDTADGSAWLGHRYYASVEQIMGEGDIIEDTLEHIDDSYEAMDDARENEAFGRDDPTALGRKKVKCYSIWIQETNEVRVVAATKNGLMPLYEPFEFYGDRKGPYVRFGCYPVPNEPYPLSPLVAVYDQVTDLNMHARAAGRSADSRKSFVIADAANGPLAEALQSIKDGAIKTVPGFDRSQMEKIEMGGATKEQYDFLGYKRDLVERVSGLNEVARGTVGIGDTATELNIAQEALDKRLGYIRNAVTDGVGELLRRVGWYLFHTEGIVIPVNIKDNATGESQDALFLGGPDPTDQGAKWEDFDVKVEPYSMTRVNEATLKQNKQMLFDAIVQTAPMVPENPHVRWGALYDMMGENVNIKDAGSKFFDFNLVQQVQPEPSVTPTAGLPSRSLRNPPPRNSGTAVPGGSKQRSTGSPVNSQKTPLSTNSHASKMRQ